jgi:phosphate transport system permease protein
VSALPRTSPKVSQAVAFALLWIAAVVVIVPVAAILAIMLLKGGKGLSWELISSVEEGLLPAIAGTAALVALTALISAPASTPGPARWCASSASR